ncbi:MAG: hypothetical protein ABR521_13625 [Gaiellaceae bacterium]
MKDGLGTLALAMLAISCCAGLPLLLAAGLSAAAAVWVGGITFGLAIFAAAVALLALRARHRAASNSVRHEAVAQPRNSLKKKEVQIR